MSRKELTLKERQNKEAREKAREDRQIWDEHLNRARLDRRINRGIRREIPEEIPVVDNPTYSPSPTQVRSPLHFTNLVTSGEEGRLTSSPGLPNPQNSPAGSQNPTPPHLQTPPTTTFFSALTSRLERAVQQIVSSQGISQSLERIERVVSNEDELENLTNNGTPFENSIFLGDGSIRNLFPSPRLPLPISYSIPEEQFDELPVITRPIEESFASPLNQSFLSNSPFNPLYSRNQS